MTKRIAGPRLPIIVTEIAYSQAAIWADRQGVSLRDYTEAALEAANRKAERDYNNDLYAQACRDAEVGRGIMPTRHEWDREQQPFVRCQRSASENQSGHPSSRRNQNGTAPQSGSKSAKPGPERPAATRSAASMARTREDPHFDVGEDRVTSSDVPPEDRWGPLPEDVQPPPRKNTQTP